MSTRRLQEALRIIGHCELLLQKFEDECMDDDALDFCMDDKISKNDLMKICDKNDTFLKFVKSYQKLQDQENQNGISDQQPTASRLVTVQQKPSFMTGQLNELNPSKPKNGHITSSEPKYAKKGPVQIIDLINKTQSQGGTQLILKEENLTQILQNVKNRRVAVLSIAGPSRQGKSFLLSYMIKYLRRISQGEHSSDWMGKSESEREAPLQEGFPWRNGVDPQTTGVNMWPEPFTLTSNDGSEFDVLLMDTPGVFDHYTEEKDWATIVGLSLLTSSALIFNISKNLQENTLKSLKGFMDFGQIAVDSSSECQRPFQSLTFLIRDWNNASEYSYGAKGGAEFLKYQLNQKYTVSGGEIREQIKDSFEQLHCFLMPDPGENVKDKNYDGSVAGMAPNFALGIKEFVETLFDPSTFPLMTISGNPVTGLDLLTYFKKYVEIFNSDMVPSSEDMNKAMTTICNQTVVNNCVAVYEAQFDKLKSQVQRKFLLEKELQEFHAFGINTAIGTFDSSRKMGSDSEVNQMQIDLRDGKLQHLYKNLYLQNKEHFHAALGMEVDNLKRDFEESVVTQIAALPTGIDKFLPQQILEEILKDAEEETLRRLEINLQIPNLDSIKGDLDSILLAIKTISDLATRDNQLLKFQAESALDMFLENLTLNFTDQLTICRSTQGKYVTTTEFEKIFTSELKTIKSQFHKNYGASSLFNSGEAELLQKIDTVRHEMLEGIKSNRDLYVMNCKDKMSEYEKKYERDMSSELECGHLFTSFSKCHAEAKSAALVEFVSSESAQKLIPSEEVETLKSELSSRIDLKCNEFAQKCIKEKRPNLVEQFKEALQTLVQHLDSGDPFVDDSTLKQLHEKETEKVQQEFQNFVHDILSISASPEIQSTAALAKNELQSDIDAQVLLHREIVLQKNKTLEQEYERQVKITSKLSADAYKNKLKEIGASFLTEADFNQKAIEAMQKSMEDFQKESMRSTSPSLSLLLLPTLRLELKAQLEKITEKRLEVVLLKIQQAMTNYLQDLLKSFSEQLTKSTRDNYVKDTEFEEIFTSGLDILKSDFSKTYETSSFFQDGEAQMLKQVEVLRTEILSKLEATNGRLKKDCAYKVNKIVRTYERIMDSSSFLPSFSKCHTEAKSSALVEFMSSKSAQKLPAENVEPFKLELTSRLALSCSHFAHKVIKEERERLLAQFKNTLKTHDQSPTSNDTLVDDSTLQMLYDEEKAKISQDFQDYYQDILKTGAFTRTGDTINLTAKELQDNIDEEIQLHKQSVLQRNQTLTLEYVRRVEKILKHSANRYSDELDEIGTTSLTEVDFNERALTAMERTLNEFEIESESGTSPSLFSMVFPPLHQDLEAELEKKREQKLEVVLIKVQLAMTNFLQDLLHAFTNELTKSTQDKYVTTSQFQEIFISALEKTKSVFSQNYKKSTFFKGGEVQLLQKADAVRNKILEIVESNRNLLLMNCKVKINELEKKYKRDMSSELECGHLLNYFSKYHSKIQKACILNFASSESAQKLPPEELETFKLELTSRLALISTRVAHMSIREKRGRLLTQFKEVLTTYEQKLDIDKTLVEHFTLEKFYAKEKGKVTKEFKNFLGDIRRTGTGVGNTAYMSDASLISDMDKDAKLHRETVLKKNELLACKFERQVKDVMKDSAYAYGNELKEITKWSESEADFHEKAFAATRKNLKNFEKESKTRTSPFLSPTFLLPLRQELKGELVKKRDQELSSVLSKLQQDEVDLTYAVPQVKRAYRDEMDKVFERRRNTLSLMELCNEHTSISQSVLYQYKQTNELPPYSIKELRKELDVLHKCFREKIKRHNNKITPAIGIDLGTTYSCVAVIRAGNVEVIKNTRGESFTPSVVHYPEGGRRPVVAGAKEEAYKDPENTVFDAKRLIGRKFVDPVVQHDMKLWPFKVANAGNWAEIEIRGKIEPPEQTSSHILSYLKKCAEERLNLQGKIQHAVITVPAYFNDAQRQATKDAGKMAGLKVLQIINEPVAAAIAYGLDDHNAHVKNVLIFDLAARTLDISVLHIKKGDIHVKALGGDRNLGGEDFDNQLVTYCLKKFKDKSGVDLRRADHQNKVLRRLQNECEKRKRQLSQVEMVNIRVEKIKDNYDLDVRMTKDTFEELCAPLFQKCIDEVDTTLKDAQLDETNIDDVVLVGGSTEIPKIREMLQKYFNGKPLILSKSSDEVVAHGAAMLACELNPGQEDNQFCSIT